MVGDPERLTAGTSLEVFPAVASGPNASLRIAFASMIENIDVWGLPFEGSDGANRGKATGELRRLTEDAALDAMPTITADGKMLVFGSSRRHDGGQMDISGTS